MKYTNYFFLFLLMFCFGPIALSQICTAPVVDQNNSYGYNLNGIGDGCTLKQDAGPITINSEWIPNIYFFKSTFTASCDRHDKCLTQIGNSGGNCNSEFYSNMRNACDSKYPWYRPIERDICRQTAFMYYQAVESYVTQATVSYFQRASLIASAQLRNNIESDTCGTTPERTLLYSNSLISEINAAFLAIARRTPTIYEFLNAVHSGDYVYSRDAWRANLQQLAATASYVQVPTISFTANTSWGLQLLANSVPSANYTWKVNGRTSYSQNLVLLSSAPMYNTTIAAKGFLTLNFGSYASRNMLVVDQTFSLRGECSPRPGLPCY